MPRDTLIKEIKNRAQLVESKISVTGNEINISESLVRCVSQPKKVNVLTIKTELLEQFRNK